MNQDTDINLIQGDVERLTGPASTFTHPDEVLHTRSLSVADKRSILAAWASDAHAVPDLPAMRQLDSGAMVTIDTVLAALRKLGAQDVGAKAPITAPRRTIPRSLDALRYRPWKRRQDYDDDDPPPCPATAMPPGVELELRRRAADWHLAAA